MVDKPSWIHDSIKKIDQTFIEKAQAHQNQLTKPPGSLGELESIAIQFCSWQRSLTPDLSLIQVLIYASDHGIAEEKVSAFPQSVTAEMIRNFSSSGAAISVLANFSSMPLKVVNMGSVTPLEPLAGVEDCRISAGTENFLNGPAMSREQLIQALECGKQQAETSYENGTQLLILGEMGIANTSSAAAIAAAIFELKAEQITGRGTGVDEQGLQHKIQVIDSALNTHQGISAPLECLQTFGGFEIAAMTGSYLRAAQLGIPLLIDGFISTIAAVVAIKLNPDVRDWMLFAHCSAEQGHQVLLDFLKCEPILNLNLRLGEGSGAAVAVPILRAACALHNQMATFEQAQVSQG